MQGVHVATVARGGVSAAWTMLMSMVGMGRGRAGHHGLVPFSVQDPRPPRCGSRPHGR